MHLVLSSTANHHSGAGAGRPRDRSGYGVEQERGLGTGQGGRVRGLHLLFCKQRVRSSNPLVNQESLIPLGTSRLRSLDLYKMVPFV